MKIKTIRIHNYRAFYPQFNTDSTPKPYEIKIEGKNVLIYGENGSGKTSLFRAVRDFINSSSYTTPLELNAFFIPVGTIPEGEVNIDFTGGKTFTFKNVAGQTTTQSSAELRQAQKASGWLTYFEVLKTYLIDKGKPELFDLLVSKILNNHLLPPFPNRTIGEEWGHLQRNINANRRSTYVKSLLDANGNLNCDSFNSGLRLLLKGNADIVGIETIINKWLADYFKNGLQIEFNFTEVRQGIHPNKQRQRRRLERSLTLEITLNGRLIPKSEYQQFLNEARLSALAIGIFLAAYKTYPTAALPTKILYLDDVFIGLDMSNRLPLLDIIEKEFVTEGYQVFVSTYDRAWFELAKMHLKSWTTLEMYAGEDDTPVIIQDEGNFKKAEGYFKAKDYLAAGNLLRKELERLVLERIPVTYRFDTGGNPITELDRLIGQLLKYYKECSCEDLIDSNLMRKLKLFKDIILNPSSHYDLQSPIYRVEVEKTFDIVDSLSKIPVLKRTLLLGIGSSVFYKNVENNYDAEYILKENIYRIEISEADKRITDAKHILFRYTHNGTTTMPQNDQAILLSKRHSKIETFLQLANHTVNWKTDLKTVTNDDLTTLAAI